MKIPGSELTLARRRGAAGTTIDFIGEITDEYGFTIQNIRDNVDIKLSDEDAEQISPRPIQYESGYTRRARPSIRWSTTATSWCRA